MTTLRFHGSAAVLLLPLALFVAVTARLFISEAAFDLTGLAAAGVLTLFSGSLLAKAPSEYWKAAVRGASSELTGTVVLILIASGIFSAMMKASGVADGLVFLGGMLHLTGHAFTVFVLLASSLMAAATGSSIGTLLAAMPIFFPAGVALGADPAMLAGAVLSGAIFGDNLAPVSDVTVISSVTQRFRNGTPADIAGVVRTRLPYAMIALAVSLPVYAFMGESLPVSEAALSGDASALLMLVPVAVLIAVAVRTRDVLMAISAGVVTGTATGLLIGRLSFATIFAAVDSRLSGFLISGISNVSPIILLCVTLRTELFLSAATLVVTTLFAAVTSASVALVGSLTDDIGRASNVHPYRRSHILSGLANSLPVLMPFSAFVLITMAAVSGLEGAAAVTPFTLMTAAFYPIALFLVFGFMVLTGTGRMMETPEPEAAEAKTATAL